MATDAILNVVTEAELGTKGLVVTISQDGDILGHLMVGKASIVWFEKGAKKKGHKISWKAFRAWILEKPEVSAARP